MSLPVVLLLRALILRPAAPPGFATHPLLRPPAPIECAQRVRGPGILRAMCCIAATTAHLCPLGAVWITCLCAKAPGALESPDEDVQWDPGAAWCAAWYIEMARAC